MTSRWCCWSGRRRSPEIDERLRQAGKLAAVLSPHLTVEEAYLLATYIRTLDPQAPIVLGPVPVEGEDETFKNGFTIHAEKCPNRRGVEEIVRHFTGRVGTLDDLLAAIDPASVSAVWVSGGYKHDWIDDATAERLAAVACLVVQDMFHSPLLERATYRLPGAAFRRARRLVRQSCRPAAERSTGRSGRRPACASRRACTGNCWGEAGWSSRARVLDEVAREIPFFAAAADSGRAAGCSS